MNYLFCEGIPVSYKDVESIDPDFAKSLQVIIIICMLCAHVFVYFMNVIN